MNYPLPQGYPQPAPPVAPVPAQQFPPQYPQAPQQGYPMTPPAPQYPGYPSAPAQGYAPQQFGQQAPPAPAVNATIDDFYNQPSGASGPSLGWKTKQGQDRPVGSWFAGYVARDVTNGDVDQQTNTQGVPQYFKDGRPKLQMKVALKGIQTSDGGVDHPDGDGTWYVKGQGRDELTRAMAEAGVTGVPQGGAYIVVTLVQRRPNGSGYNPTNVVSVSYTPSNSPAPAAPAPVAAQPQQAPAPAPAPPAPPMAPPVAPVAAAPAPLPAPPAAPAAPLAQVPQPPSTLDPNAQAILSQLTPQG